MIIQAGTKAAEKFAAPPGKSMIDVSLTVEHAKPWFIAPIGAVDGCFVPRFDIDRSIKKAQDRTF